MYRFAQGWEGLKNSQNEKWGYTVLCGMEYPTPTLPFRATSPLVSVQPTSPGSSHTYLCRDLMNSLVFPPIT